MTDAELVSGAQAVWANVIALIAILLSILSAYLVVGYMAGSKMTPQAGHPLAMLTEIYIETPLIGLAITVLLPLTKAD